MTKKEFLDELRKNLSGLPKREVEERLNFYSEMIEDRIEEGCTEEEAVSKIGTVEEISAQITSEIPLIKIAKEKILGGEKQISGWVVLFLVLGAPIWFSLLVAAFSVAVSMYAVAWSLIVVVWAVFISLSASGPAAVILGIVFLFTKGMPVGLSTIGSGLVVAGLAVFCFFACKGVTKAFIGLHKNVVMSIKKRLSRKGA